MNLNVQEKKGTQRESTTQHTKPTIPNKECLQRMHNSKGMFHRHSQQEAPKMKMPPKDAQLQGGEPNTPKHNLNSK
jgi:hypothetical protein